MDINDYAGFPSITNADPTFGLDNTVGNYDVATHNRLIGLQAGMEYTYRQCRWNAEFTAKSVHSSISCRTTRP